MKLNENYELALQQLFRSRFLSSNSGDSGGISDGQSISPAVHTDESPATASVHFPSTHPRDSIAKLATKFEAMTFQMAEIAVAPTQSP
jgi:hypothetical protein